MGKKSIRYAFPIYLKLRKMCRMLLNRNSERIPIQLVAGIFNANKKIIAKNPIPSSCPCH